SVRGNPRDSHQHSAGVRPGRASGLICVACRRLTAVAGYARPPPSVRLGWLAAPAADRPGADALRVQHVFGHPDLLIAAGTTRAARAAVGPPGARRELQTTGVTVTGADRPVATR